MTRKHYAGRHMEGRARRQSGPLQLTVVQGDDVEAVEELAFVFMNPLHLDVEE